MIYFELPTAHRPNSALIMRDIAAELLNLQQQIRDRSMHGFSTDEIAELDARREELHVLYAAIERQSAATHVHHG
jgi:hypothetical protein